MTPLRALAPLLFAASLCCATASAVGWQHIGVVEQVTARKDGVELAAGPAKVRISIFRPGVVRIRFAPDGVFPKDFSWAVVESPEPPSFKLEDAPNELSLTTETVVVRVQKSPLLLSFADALGHVLLADETTLPMSWNSHNVRVWKNMPAGEVYFGLGDKAGPMNRRDRAFTNWNTDAFGWGESSDPLYKSIPFFLALREGTAYGVFLDNTYRSSFDFGKESRDYFSFGAEGGELNYYFFAGPTPKRVLEEFTALVGRSPLPPLWSLGYQQCRYSYYPEARVREIARLLREKKIPADVIYLDIDYQQDYAPFTINRQRFPQFERMISDLRAQGFHTILITDLHIKKDPDHGYAPYDSGMANDVFLKNPDGSLYVGDVWPGASVFPDFTLSRVRDWWGNLYKDFVRMGVAGFWNDMNEPAIFHRADKTMPLDVVHRLDDGTTLDHRAVHNIYGMQNARATYEGLRKLEGDERPFVLTRAAYAGTERYAATWTGDNSSTWNHLEMSTPTLLSLGISGYGLVGDDIGGFAGSPAGELLTRWFEVGALNPIYRNHAEKGSPDKEPWVQGPEHEAVRRHFIELRYQLLPYIYSSIEKTSRTGWPLMRPVWLEYPPATDFYGDIHDFLFGPDLFVAPVVTERNGPETVRLPPGEWYDYWTDQKHTAADHLTLRPALEQLPLYVRAGAVIPMQPVVQHTGEKPDGPLALRVYSGERCEGSLYQDDGHTFAYQRGQFLRVHYSCQVSAASIVVTSSTETNAYAPWWTSTNVTVLGAADRPKAVRLRNQVTNRWTYDAQTRSVTLTVPDALRNWSIEVTF